MRTILRNAKIWLGGDQFASAVLFDSSQILAVGTDAQVEAQRQNGDQIIDVQGRLVLPGLCDTHLHCYNKAARCRTLICRMFPRSRRSSAAAGIIFRRIRIPA